MAYFLGSGVSARWISSVVTPLEYSSELRVTWLGVSVGAAVFGVGCLND